MTGAIIDPIQCGYENLQLLGEYEFGGDTSYTFSHLHGYTDLKYVIIGSYKTSSATALAQSTYIRFNSDSSAHYYLRQLVHSSYNGTTSTVDSGTYITLSSVGASDYTSSEVEFRIEIFAKEDYPKSVVGYSNTTTGSSGRCRLALLHDQWTEDSEITSITVGRTTTGVTIDEGSVKLYRVIQK